MEIERDPYAPTPPPGQDQLPSDDGEPMETWRHRLQSSLLIEPLREHWPDRPDVFASGNMFVYFSELQTRGEHFRGPDVLVVLGTTRKARKSWVQWEEGGQLPDVVIELLSESTRAVDRGDKMRIYERVWKLGTYVLYDPWSHELEGYLLDPASGRYKPIARADSGDLPVARLGLSLGLRGEAIDEEPGPFLRWIERDGTVVETARERAEAERSRAEAERNRAEAERNRADAERERADRAEARLARLEAERGRRRR
jgi:Uma2 family endonuclease